MHFVNIIIYYYYQFNLLFINKKQFKDILKSMDDDSDEDNVFYSNKMNKMNFNIYFQYIGCCGNVIKLKQNQIKLEYNWYLIIRWIICSTNKISIKYPNLINNKSITFIKKNTKIKSKLERNIIITLFIYI